MIKVNQMVLEKSLMNITEERVNTIRCPSEIRKEKG